MPDDRKLTFSLTVDQAAAARLVLADEGKLAPFDPAIEVLRRALERPTLDRSELHESSEAGGGGKQNSLADERSEDKAVPSPSPSHTEEMP